MILLDETPSTQKQSCPTDTNHTFIKNIIVTSH